MSPTGCDLISGGRPQGGRTGGRAGTVNSTEL